MNEKKSKSVKRETKDKSKSKRRVSETQDTPETGLPLETGAIADAPMMGESQVLGTLSADAPGEVKETPKRSRRKQEATEGAETRPPEAKPSAAESPMETPPATPAVLSAEAEFPPSPPTAQAEPAEVEHEPLKLARGALVTMRKSGGLKFSTREVVVYPDGRVAYDARGVPQKEYTRLRRVLNDGQINSLRKLLDQTNFWHAESVGQQNPDAFAYEIAARHGQRSNEIEVFDGSIPENLKPLVERLVKLLPE